MIVPFSPPDITQNEIDRVVAVLRSGWITTGRVTKQFERDIATYCGTKKAVCLSSATAAMELSLRMLGVTAGDEVITSAYTYSASAAVIAHTGAAIVLADTVPGGVHIDPESVKERITDRTKAVIPVDIAGIPADYEGLYRVINEKRALFRHSCEIQKNLGRIAVVGDAAHAFGAEYKGRSIADQSDFCCFSFHAVKNLTTAEGGCIAFNDTGGIPADELYRKFMLMALHGQNKDALTKTEGAWEYDIELLGYKYNMPDILAAFGQAQLERYDEMLRIRRELAELYNRCFEGTPVKPLVHECSDYTGSFHAYIIRIDGFDTAQRNRLIEEMGARGIALNVHFKPLPLHTAYKALGFDIKDYPNAYDYYKAAVTLPLYSSMTKDMAEYVAGQLLEVLRLKEFADACP